MSLDGIGAETRCTCFFSLCVASEMQMLGKSIENTWEVPKSYEPKPGPVDILGDATELSEEDYPF